VYESLIRLDDLSLLQKTLVILLDVSHRIAFSGKGSGLEDDPLSGHHGTETRETRFSHGLAGILTDA